MNKQLQFLFYNTPDESVKAKVFLADDTVWLTQEQMSSLFNKAPSTISEHISNIYSTDELQEEETMTTKFGNSEFNKGQPPKYYNLDVIIAVGYRVNSIQATMFRKWATKVLREYMIKGFVLDDERLKQSNTTFGKDYFRELLERIRSIRASERRIWQQITDIFAECSIDYDRDSQITQDFFAMVQNKFHYAITGKTAAGIIYDNADRQKEHMGLTTWKNAPDGRILKSDVVIAKNYLPEKQIKQLERTVTGFFDYIEDLIERENAFSMEQFANSVDKFLSFREYRVLTDKGAPSKRVADQKAYAEYDEFNKTQKIISDFDKEVRKLVDGEKMKAIITSKLKSSEGAEK